MWSKKLILLTAVFMLVLAGCKSNDNDAENSQGSENITPPQVVEGEEEEEVGTEVTESRDPAPLTGKAGETNLDARPVAVMVNNDVKARPQSGLHKADVVYEVLAEGDITRLLAIFHSEMPDAVGPVRSARDYFVDLTKGYDALFVFHGWSPDARAKVEAGEVDGINGLTYDGILFKRASFRKAPHNSYITSENIDKGAVQLNYSLQSDVPPFTFLKDGKNTQLEGIQTEIVKLAYSSRQVTHVEYKYDAKRNLYVRYSGGEKHTDLETMTDITADNIFIVETAHKVIDDVGRREIDITSGGKGILIQNGERYEVDWQEEKGRILPYLNGQPVPFAPGKTWIQLIPDLQKVTF